MAMSYGEEADTSIQLWLLKCAYSLLFGSKVESIILGQPLGV